MSQPMLRNLFTLALGLGVFGTVAITVDQSVAAIAAMPTIDVHNTSIHTGLDRDIYTSSLSTTPTPNHPLKSAPITAKHSASSAKYFQAAEDLIAAYPLGEVRLAREGGDPKHRWATFIVPQGDTATTIEDSPLRWYDAHLAMMIALTADQFCGHPSAQGAYFNYEAEGGAVFMGKLFISCDAAREIMDEYGRAQTAGVRMQEGGFDLGWVAQPIPQLSDVQVSEFQEMLIEQFPPSCLETGGYTICPGDRL